MSRNPSAVFSFICLLVLKNLPHLIQCGHLSYTHHLSSSLGRDGFRTRYSAIYPMFNNFPELNEPQKIDKFSVLPFPVGKRSLSNVYKENKFSGPLVTIALKLMASLGMVLLLKSHHTSPGIRYQHHDKDPEYLSNNKNNNWKREWKPGEVEDTNEGDKNSFTVALAAVADAVSIVYHTLGIMARLGLGIGNG